MMGLQAPNIVMFDYTAQKPTPVPDALRAKIEAKEGRKVN